MKTLAAAISAAVLAGPAMAQEARVYPLPDRAAYPEGITIAPDGRTAYLSSPNTGIVFAVDLPTGDVREIGDPLGRDPNAPVMSVTLGVKLDGQGRLWFAGARTGGMHVVDSRSGDLIAAFTTPDEPALINDLAIAGDGVYFTDTLRPYLWRVPLDDPQGGALEPWLAFDGTALEYGEEPNLNGIAATPDGVLPETVERADHPWFIGVQYHPELKSRPFAPHPLFASFIAAAVVQSRLV